VIDYFRALGVRAHAQRDATDAGPEETTMGPTGGEGQEPGRAGPDPGGGAGTEQIRPGRPADAAAVAALHARQIDEGFLSFLGAGFLTLLYRRITLEPSAFLLIALDGDRVVGFVAGADDVASLYRRFVWHDGLRAALRAAGPLVRGWRRAVETARHVAGGSTGGAGRGTELLSIAVAPDRQGAGTGGRLVRAFLDRVETGVTPVAYVVVAATNRTAVSLYQRAGFVQASTFELHPGTPSLVLQWDRAAGPGGQDGAG
jgi:ribosomal protein S18 acetylase RimI-like enzyme